MQDEKKPKEEQGNTNFQTPSKTPKCWVQKNHPLKHIIEDKSARIETRRRRKVGTPEKWNFSLLSIVDPSSFEEAKNDEH